MRGGADAEALDPIAAAIDVARASRERLAAHQAELRAAIAKGCPRCGAAMRRNSSLTGWWQCGQFGAPGFRADAAKPHCDFQGSIL